MNEEQRNIAEAEQKLIQDIDAKAQIRTARLLMIIPSALMAIAGLFFVYMTSFKRYAPNETGMWQTWTDFFIIVPIFLLSVLITLVCMITGLILLHQARKSH